MRIKKSILAWLCALSMCAQATSFTTDISDMWWNSSESGWGLNIIQQSDTLFMTFFIYGSNGNAVWYVAPATTYTSGFTFSGPLYQTTGPWFGGGFFNPSAVGVRQVGTATFVLANVNTATLSYSADGLSANKALTRQTWRTENLVGSYLGATIGTYSGCAANGYSEETGSFVVAQSGSAITISSLTSQGVSCTYGGTYTQTGRMGTIAGTASCSNGSSGALNAAEVTVSVDSLTGHAVIVNGGCIWNGRFGGLRRGS